MACEWASSAAHVFKDAASEELVQAVLRDSDVYAGSPNYWISKEDIMASSRDAVCSAEACIITLYHSCLKAMLADDWQGAEWWVQVYEKGKGLKFHFDKDEHAFAQKGTMLHPHFSSILYLTGAAPDGYHQGPTVILQQHFNTSTSRPEPDSPDACILVYPHKRQFCVFDGALGHGVLESCSSARRVTLLINWWGSCPQDVHPFAPDPGSDLANLPHTPVGPENLQGHPVQAENIPVLVLPQPPAEPVLVDDLQDESKSSTPGASVPACCFKHPGYVLYPLEQDEQSPQKTMAAFVPAHMMEASSSEESEPEE